jgi:hypothetical protein
MTDPKAMECRLADNHTHQGNGFPQISKGCITVLGQPGQYRPRMRFNPV